MIGALVLIIGTAVAHAAFTPYTDHVPGVRVRSEVSRSMKPQYVAARPAPSEVAMAQLLAERRCLAQAMYYEARGEGMRGEKAVAEVVFHRMRSRIYPATICGVVFQGAEQKISCQFSFVCNGDMDKPIEKHAWAEARLLAAKIMTGAMPLGDITDDATSYHAVSVDPVWAAHLVRTVQIGNHIFYRRPATRSRSM
jgi:spore germination cell wall hydrolase CwlJ-like protein